VAVGEQQDPAVAGGRQLGQQAPGSGGGGLDRLAPGAAVAEQVPPGPGGADLRGGQALVVAVVELQQGVGGLLQPVAEPGQPGRGHRPDQGARQDPVDLQAAQVLPERLGLGLADLVQRHVGAAGVPPRPRPLGLAVPDQVHLHRIASRLGR
jgi:hypothetical protein